MALRRDTSLRLRDFARDMRKNPTDAESKLWQILRGRLLGGYKFRRQHPVGGYVVDFYCSSARLGIELDGGQHADAQVAEYDQARARRLLELGIRIIRFWDNDMLKDPDVIAEEILKCLEEPSPRPSPGVPGEGERNVLR